MSISWQTLSHNHDTVFLHPLTLSSLTMWPFGWWFNDLAFGCDCLTSCIGWCFNSQNILQNQFPPAHHQFSLSQTCVAPFGYSVLRGLQCLTGCLNNQTDFPACLCIGLPFSLNTSSFYQLI